MLTNLRRVLFHFPAACLELPLLGETGAHLWARVRGEFLKRKRPFDGYYTTIDSIPLNLTFSPGRRDKHNNPTRPSQPALCTPRWSS